MAPSQPSGWPQELVDNSNINQSDDGLSIKCTLCETSRGKEVLLTMRLVSLTNTTTSFFKKILLV